MRVVGLLSGGKDSCYALMQCIAAGHKAVALATLLPPPGVEESNSHMYQSVGVHHVWRVAKAMGDVPFFSRTIEGKSVNTSADYAKALPEDEVEDLFHLLKSVKDGVEGGVDGVSVGAILSDYQRVRVENVCGRLGLVCLSYLWRREQQALLKEMLQCGVEAVLVKAAGAGLVPQQHCGLTLNQLQPTLLKLNSKFDLHVCGEGGEFETFTTDCPLFEKRLNIVRHRLVEEPGDVGYLVLEELALEDKQGAEKTMEKRVLEAGVPGPSHFVQDVLSLQLPEAPLSPDAGKEVLSEAPAVPAHLQQLFRRPAAPPQPVVVLSSGGWWLATGYGGACVDTVLQQLAEDLKAKKLALGEACEVRAFVQSLAKYAEFNVAYKRHFGHGPPVRACVESCILHECQLEILGFSEAGAGDTHSPRRVLHVQSVSHWAPANIGPYSQAVMVGPQVWLAGMIGLVGGTLEVVEGGAPVQAALALRHVDRVLACITGRPEGGALRQLLQVVCYSRSVAAGREAERALGTLRCPVLHLVVQRLPKDADVELHCAANIHATASQVTTMQCALRGLRVRLQCMRVTHADAVVATLDGDEDQAHEGVSADLLVQLVRVAVGELLTGAGELCSSHLLALTLFYAQDKVPPRVAEDTISAIKSVNRDSGAGSSSGGLPSMGVGAVPVSAIGRDGRSIAAVVINTLAPPAAQS